MNDKPSNRKYVRQRLIQSAVRKSSQKATQGVQPQESDTTQYGEKAIQNTSDEAVSMAQTSAIDTGRISYRQFRAMQVRRASRQVFSEHTASDVSNTHKEAEKIEALTSQERREMFKHGRYRVVALQKAEKTEISPTFPTDQVQQSRLIKTKQQNLKRQHFIREAVRRHFQAQSRQNAAGAAIYPNANFSVKLPSDSKKHPAFSRIQALFRYLMNTIRQLLARTIRQAAAALMALLATSGVVLVLAMVVGAAAAVIGSPMGILFADESGDPSSIKIAEIVAETNIDFGAAINDIVSAHPKCNETTINYDYEDGHTWASYWPEVLAIFAVHTNLNSDSDVVVIDEAKKQLIQGTFWSMHIIDYEIESVITIPEPTDDDPDPEPVTEYILHINVSSKSVDTLAEEYRFTQDQKDILHELLSDEMRPSLLALCGNSSGVIVDGEFCWPLPGHTTISCNFGEPDAFGNPGHRGTDIPAPEGTPILAAHSGTVIISGWNDSYGNQVLLDNGAGLSTRYAHMTQSAVAAGETVTAGQVIGYVGSTGDSTGNHLHFEVLQSGIRIDPLDMFSPK